MNRLPPVVVRYVGAPTRGTTPQNSPALDRTLFSPPPITPASAYTLPPPPSPGGPLPAYFAPRVSSPKPPSAHRTEMAPPHCPPGHTAVRGPSGWMCVITGPVPGSAKGRSAPLYGIPRGLGVAPGVYADAISQIRTIMNNAVIPQPAGNVAAIQQAATTLAGDVSQFQPADVAAVTSNASYQAVMSTANGSPLTDPQAASLNGSAAGVLTLLTPLASNSGQGLPAGSTDPFAYATQQLSAIAVYLQNMISATPPPALGPLGDLISAFTTAVMNMPAAAKQSLTSNPNYIVLTGQDWGTATNGYTTAVPSSTLSTILAATNALQAAVASLSTPACPPGSVPAGPGASSGCFAPGSSSPVTAPAAPAGIDPTTAVVGGAALLGGAWLVAKFLL
jgi:hypothetical protein